MRTPGSPAAPKAAHPRRHERFPGCAPSVSYPWQALSDSLERPGSSDLGCQPGLCRAPVPFDRPFANAERRLDFRIAQSAKEAENYQFGLPGTDLGERIQSGVEPQEI